MGKIVKVAEGPIDGAKSLKSMWAEPQAIIQVRTTDLVKGETDEGDMTYLILPMMRGRLDDGKALEGGLEQGAACRPTRSGVVQATKAYSTWVASTSTRARPWPT